jgi:hypothetical protein
MSEKEQHNKNIYKMSVTIKKIPRIFQIAIKHFYGRGRLLELSKIHSIHWLSLLHHLERCYNLGLSLKNIESEKVIPSWGKNKHTISMSYETIPKQYCVAIARHFSIRKAKQVCLFYGLDVTLFVRMLEACYTQNITFWDLSCKRIEIHPVEVPMTSYITDHTILCPVFEFMEFTQENTYKRHNIGT